MIRSFSNPAINATNSTPPPAVRDMSFITKHQKSQIHIHLMETATNKFTRIRIKPKRFYKLEFSEVKYHPKVINDIISIRLTGPHSIRHFKGLGVDDLLRLLIREEDLTPSPPSNLGAFYRELVINQLSKCIQSCKTHSDIAKWCRKGEFSVDIRRDLKFLIIKEVFSVLVSQTHS